MSVGIVIRNTQAAVVATDSGTSDGGRRMAPDDKSFAVDVQGRKVIGVYSGGIRINDQRVAEIIDEIVTSIVPQTLELVVQEIVARLAKKMNAASHNNESPYILLCGYSQITQGVLDVYKIYCVRADKKLSHKYPGLNRAATRRPDKPVVDRLPG